MTRVRKTMNLPQALVAQLDRNRSFQGESFSSVCIRVLTRGLHRKRKPIKK
jgi:hypothetical protein